MTETLAAIAEEAHAAAAIAVESGNHQLNPYGAGTPEATEWQRRYEIALLRLSAPESAEASA